MANEVWIVYKAEDMDAPGWEERQLMPRASLTDILWENWSGEQNPTLPKPGDRTRNYKSDENGLTTHGKDGDWVVSRIHQFSSFDTDLRIVVAYCQYQPIDSQWQELRRGKPVDELMQTEGAAF